MDVPINAHHAARLVCGISATLILMSGCSDTMT